MLKNFIISFLIVTNIITAAFCFRLHYRLEQSRQLIEHYRTELNAAEDRQQRIREIVRGTDEILSESLNTVAGIRSQIAVIRESYEKMENLLYGIGSNDTNYDSGTNNEAIKDERKSEEKN